MFPDFFMHIGQALDLVSRYDSLRNPLTSLGDYLDPELISRCLAESGTVTLRKRRLPLEMMVWCIVGMALERKEPLHQTPDCESPGHHAAGQSPLRCPQCRYSGPPAPGK
ncbi:IS4 orf [Shigella flexneri CDC 796-83]|uniref:IS4 orf n=1 Tax=Shigella flexneri CDC 796-83 TaxID=945360 RepID=A0A6N3QLM9_SHIFL|nr:IS4 orf [Shigella flexneri CDC 796-83]